MSLMLGGESKEAVKLFQKAVEHAPHDPLRHMGLGAAVPSSVAADRSATYERGKRLNPPA